MAYREMNLVTGSHRHFAYEAEISLSGAGSSDWILVPRNNKIDTLTITLSVTNGGQGKIQTTTSLLDTVKNGTPIVIDWPSGTVTADTADTANPPTAFRLVQTNAVGETKLNARGQ